MTPSYLSSLNSVLIFCRRFIIPPIVESDVLNSCEIELADSPDSTLRVIVACFRVESHQTTQIEKLLDE